MRWDALPKCKKSVILFMEFYMRKFLSALIVSGVAFSGLAMADGATVPLPPKFMDGATVPLPPKFADGATVPLPPKFMDGATVPLPPKFFDGATVPLPPK